MKAPTAARAVTKSAGAIGARARALRNLVDAITRSMVRTFISRAAAADARRKRTTCVNVTSGWISRSSSTSAASARGISSGFASLPMAGSLVSIPAATIFESTASARVFDDRTASTPDSAGNGPASGHPFTCAARIPICSRSTPTYLSLRKSRSTTCSSVTHG